MVEVGRLAVELKPVRKCLDCYSDLHLFIPVFGSGCKSQLEIGTIEGDLA